LNNTHFETTTTEAKALRHFQEIAVCLEFKGVTGLIRVFNHANAMIIFKETK